MNAPKKPEADESLIDPAAEMQACMAGPIDRKSRNFGRKGQRNSYNTAPTMVGPDELANDSFSQKQRFLQEMVNIFLERKI